MAQLLYGAGLRLMECLRLRVKDIDIPKQQITVRQGKGDKDRVTILPMMCLEALQQQLAHSRRLHAQDLAEGYGAVELPDALARKYPGAARAWAWQYVFPAAQRSRDPRSGEIRRHHMLEDNLQRAMRRAIDRAGITKHGSAHTLRHSFATHLIEDGYDTAPCRSCLGTAMSVRRRSTCMCSTVVVAVCEAHSIRASTSCPIILWAIPASRSVYRLLGGC